MPAQTSVGGCFFFTMMKLLKVAFIGVFFVIFATEKLLAR
jgi:hypothetical protein